MSGSKIFRGITSLPVVVLATHFTVLFVHFNGLTMRISKFLKPKDSIPDKLKLAILQNCQNKTLYL